MSDLSIGAVASPRPRLACPRLSVDPATDRWFVVRTQPRRERWAAENCARQGCEFYLPEILTPAKSIVNGKFQQVSKLQRLFPGYLFVLTPARQWQFLHSTFGVLSIVMVGPIPGTLSGLQIEQIRKREHGGYVELPPEPEKFPIGSSVKIIGENPFVGFNGIVEGMAAGDRVKVLLDLLGRKVTTLFPEGEVELL